jgi:hypothetical protein
MAKYRKKPIVVEALKWNRNDREMHDFLGGNPDKPMVLCNDNFDIYHSRVQCGLCIKTLEGTMVASIGDYIIKGIKGEFYPCKPDIFEATYEKVEEN